MKYFHDILQTINYDGNTIIDIFKKINFNIEENSKYLIEYIMKDGDTPESISYELYETTDMWWTILLINQKFDRFFDFPLPQKQLEEYIQLLIDDGIIEQSDTTEINNIRSLNNKKRQIYIIDRKFIRKFLYQIKELLEE